MARTPRFSYMSELRQIQTLGPCFRRFLAACQSLEMQVRRDQRSFYIDCVEIASQNARLFGVYVRSLSGAA
jgi:hypothetical protein